jgi:hypothetical protein
MASNENLYKNVLWRTVTAEYDTDRDTNHEFMIRIKEFKQRCCRVVAAERQLAEECLPRKTYQCIGMATRGVGRVRVELSKGATCYFLFICPFVSRTFSSSAQLAARYQHVSIPSRFGSLSVSPSENRNTADVCKLDKTTEKFFET